MIITLLPPSVLSDLSLYFSLSDVLTIELVCKGWRAVCNYSFWRSLFKRLFLLYPPTDKSLRWKSILLWKNSYYDKIKQFGKNNTDDNDNNNNDDDDEEDNNNNYNNYNNYNFYCNNNLYNFENLRGFVLSADTATKLRGQIFSFISDYLEGNCNLPIIETEIQLHSPKKFAAEILKLYKYLYLATTLQGVSFDLFHFVSSRNPILLQLAFACTTFISDERLILSTGCCTRNLSDIDAKMIVLTANFLANISHSQIIIENAIYPSKIKNFNINNIISVFSQCASLQSKVFICLLAAAARVDNIDYHMELREYLPEFFKNIKLDFSVALPLVNYVCKLVAVCGENNVESIIKTLISLYNKIPEQERFFYHGIPHPWLRVKIFQFLQLFPSSSDKLNIFISDISNMFYDNVKMEVENILNNASLWDPPAINSVYSVFLEFVNLVLLHRSRFEQSLVDTVKELLRRSHFCLLVLGPSFYTTRMLVRQKTKL